MSTMLYRRLPHVRVEWRDAAFGGIIALILFESGKQLFCWFTGAAAQTDIIYAIAGVGGSNSAVDNGTPLPAGRTAETRRCEHQAVIEY